MKRERERERERKTAISTRELEREREREREREAREHVSHQKKLVFFRVVIKVLRSWCYDLAIHYPAAMLCDLAPPSKQQPALGEAFSH